MNGSQFTVLRSQKSPARLFIRWLKFNFVGGIGIGVQLASLAIFRSLFGLNYLLATALAVEAAVIHNFLWHERFTWADRPAGRPVHSLARLVRFNFSNGAVSIIGNLLLMRMLVGQLRLNYVAANLMAITVCSLANFLLSDRFVFRRVSRAMPSRVENRI
ncbi:MAG TPA: GtrA family protein [Terriglobales bacterium]|nr:GtrA family protein [Terriglobales bacterium]